MKATILVFCAALFAAIPAAASQVPTPDAPYAKYRQQLLQNGWRPDPEAPNCGPYPEVCTGNSQGAAQWIHPVDGRKIKIHLWFCPDGLCLAAPLIDNKN